MSIVPTIKLYASDGVALLYTFEVAQDVNIPSDDEVKSIVHEAPRGKGAIVIDGGEKVWDLFVRGVFIADDYEALVVKMDALKAAISTNTAYVLKMDKTASTTYEYNVKRVEAISFPVDPANKRVNIQEYEVRFLANAW